MAKLKTVFSCSECGGQSPKWTGQCPDCGAWNTLVEGLDSKPAPSSGRNAVYASLAPTAEVQALSQVQPEEISRLSTGSGELDRVLGGGLVPGSVVLIGGDPGIGKSTLLLQALADVSQRAVVLYVSGEESAEQLALRAQRLGLGKKKVDLLAENRMEQILATIGSQTGLVVVIDSIQTVFSDLLQSAPGSVAQVRECAAQLVRLAKHRGLSMFLVGHVTKDGTLAGPRVLEHMVDTVLYFEGDTSSSFRIIRAMKNRFGAVNEIGVFNMTETGLADVSNPSAMFVSRHGDAVAGSIVLATQEGTRPLLVEIQTLVDESRLSNPRRVCVGLDQTRLAMLLAVLHRHAGIVTYDQDIFVNVAGGIRVTETAADLAVILAIYSSLRNKPLGNKLVVFGEVGLAGEIRPVQRGQDRLREAAKLGFEHAIVPYANRPKSPVPGIKVTAIRNLQGALDALSGS